MDRFESIHVYLLLKNSPTAKLKCAISPEPFQPVSGLFDLMMRF
jgi:hypothetical protein